MVGGPRRAAARIERAAPTIKELASKGAKVIVLSHFGRPDGKRVPAHLNGVSVTPLQPMMANDTDSYIDRITNIQRIRPRTAK